ncbi:MAG: PorT family protein [Paludibacteraceae bacterium]|jgi:opacity protein-like surface antigen|nr:PorT family protein [Paludibacteraceae bacterium]
MKKIILCAILACATIQFANAQKQYIGVQVGFTQPTTRLNMPVSGKEKTLTPTALNGFKVGVVYDATLVAGFGYTIGLNYTFGAKKTDWKSVGSNTYPRSYKSTMYHQLEIPVDWQYKFEIAKKTWFMLYTGPTLQCGLAFKESTYNQITSSGDITIDAKDRYNMKSVFALNRLNVTWGVGAGLQYERYFIRGGYDFGLINPYKSDVFNISDEYSPYTRGRFDQWQLKIGMYLFNW